MTKIECFKQLEVWRKARCIRKQIYQITKTFPEFELRLAGLEEDE